MKNKKYFVRIQDVCIGNLSRVVKNNGDVLILRFVRTMIFVQNKRTGNALDLLYKNSSYPILEEAGELEVGDFCIYGYKSLEQLLRHSGFDERLDYDDICYLKDILETGILNSYEENEKITYLSNYCLRKIEEEYNIGDKKVFKPSKEEGKVKKLSLFS